MASSLSRRVTRWRRESGALDGTQHALVEVVELLSAESRGAAMDSSDLDRCADFHVGITGHRDPLSPVEIRLINWSNQQFLGSYELRSWLHRS